MTSFVVTAPNGKKYKITAPQGATKEQVLAYAQQQFAAPQQAPAPPEFDAAREVGGLEAFGLAVGRGANQVYAGASDLGLRLADRVMSYARTQAPGILAEGFSPGITKRSQKAAMQARKAIAGQMAGQDAGWKGLSEARPLTTALGEGVGTVAAVPLPTGAGMGLAARVGINAAGGAIQEGLRYGTDEERRNAALRGGVAAGAVTGLLGGLGRGINALRSMVDEASKVKLARQFEAAGIPVSISDLTAPGSARNWLRYLDDLMAKVPLVGTAGKKMKQLDKSAEFLTRMREQFAARMGSDDAVKALQVSLGKVDDATRNRANQLYATVDKLAGDAPVPAINMSAKATELLERERLLGDFADKNLVGILSKYERSVANNFRTARAMRDRLSAHIRDAQQGQGGFNPSYMQSLTQLKEALEADIDEFGRRAGGQLGKAWQTAKRYWRMYRLPFREAGIVKRVNDNAIDADQIMDSMIKQGRWEKARQVYRVAGKEGRAAIEYSLLDKALNAAKIDGPKGELFKPKMFASNIQKYEKLMGNVFPPQVRQQIEGARRLMVHLESLDKHLSQAPTGYQLMGATGLGAAAYALSGNPIGQLVAALGLSFKALFATNRGRRILTNMARVSSGSPAFDALVREASEYAPRVAAAAQNDTLIDLIEQEGDD